LTSLLGLSKIRHAPQEMSSWHTQNQWKRRP